ncbi:PAS domain S-box [Beggiatoa alba B18LD]|uniref:histidine kinase n=1 Tax=Beggiatoa alba B18LD TaxID=395493 RepID=I3CFE0_9GAMM|nr:ATP-binding protein [Beggiatoa alba]EIJ42333.1 PAS domain S-box [Beggiatoa alba B18LD]
MELNTLHKLVNFKKTLDMTLDCVFMFHVSSFAFFYVNQGAITLLGYNHAELLQKNVLDIQPFTTHEQFKEKIKILLNKQLPILKFETLYQHKQGNLIPVEMIIQYIQLSDKENHFFTIVRDIRERKQIEDSLEKALESAEQARLEAEKANRSRSAFLANMSHEIRTPLNVILGFAELLQGQIQDLHHKEYLAAIKTSGHSLMQLLNDILDLSKVEAGRMVLEYTTINPLNVFYDIGNIFAEKIREKDLSLIIEPSPALPACLILDEVRLRQILLNLVGNAVKFTHQGHIKIHVTCSDFISDAQQTTVTLVFSVEDTGIGISPEQLATIFAVFEQHVEQNPQYGGSGLGLAITKRLVEMMGGRIWAHSKVNQGSIFTVSIERVAVALQDRNILETENKKSIHIDSVRFNQQRILLVDDVKFNRDLIKIFLKDADVEFIEANNGQEAINQTQKYLPHLILMDIIMPMMDGHTATRILKQNPQYAHIPIIAVTIAIVDSEEVTLQTLYDDFLKKPLHKNTLISGLIKFLPYTLNTISAKKVSTPLITTSTTSQSNLANLPISTITNSLKSTTSHSISALLTHLQQAKTEWEDISNTLIINNIEEFASKMQKVGQEYGYSPLIEWGILLESQAAMFEIQALSETLSDFPRLVDEISQQSDLF